MDPKYKNPVKGSQKPSRLLAIIALAIAFALPFALVKSFPHKIQPMTTNQSLALPDLDIQDQYGVSDDVLGTEDEQAEEQENAPPPTKGTTGDKTLANPVAPKNNSPPKPAKPEFVVRNDGWTIVKTRSGDSLAALFNRVGLTAQTLQIIIHDNPHTPALTRIKPNQEIKFQIKQKVLEQMVLPNGPTQNLVFFRDGKHYRIRLNSKQMNSQNHLISAVINGSLYGTAKRYNIPFKLIKEMTDIFTWDINFAKDIRAGDQFTIIYNTLHVGDKQVGIGDIVAVSYRNKDRTFRAIRHTNKDGQFDYYTPEGISLKKAFNRYPVRFTHISSGFSLSRYHPILHYRRAHKGVDLAAPLGTPIFATGSGTIEMIGRQNGYGNMIKIRHDKNYSSIYGHMLKFQKGLSRGDYVHRGQIIGYVGQSGLASGPHCHYEFHINNFPRNPTTVDLPRGLAISPREIAGFKANSRNLLAQLQRYENRQVARSAASGKARG